MEQKPDIIKIAAAILNSEGKLLIVHHRGQDFWISPGGKPEPGETHKQTLERELYEELRLKVVGEPVFFHESPVEVIPDGSGRTVKIFSYFVETEGKPEINPEDKIYEYAWISREDYENNKYVLATVMGKHTNPILIKQGKLK